MKPTEKRNVRGEISSMVVGGVLEFDRAEYILSSVRSTASVITGDNPQKTFNVTTEDGNIVVTRLT